ncbi:hypothetical protein GGR56DRAFT_668482 [Xylariaceae sp. FL0804]|nr:hypothetical protein GGR56DRAFT_668482 [Xylariaceae sp. FL0804]
MAVATVSNGQEGFKLSCLDSENYPLNMINSSANTSHMIMGRLKKRLDNNESRLFTEGKEDGDIDVPWRDMHTAAGEDLSKENIRSSDKLVARMGLEIDPTPGTSPTNSVKIAHQDPKCRFVYIYGDSSRSVLNITRPMLANILTFHQVMPAYLNFILVFGRQEEFEDLRFSGFIAQRSLTSNTRRPTIDALGRSGRQYQMCYSLKGITEEQDGSFTDIRQAAIHHQFDAENGRTLWLVTKGREDLKERFKELTGKNARKEDKTFDAPIDCFRASLAAHIMFCSWAAEDWRWRIKSLEKILERETSLAVLGPRGIDEHHMRYRPTDIQALQRHEDVIQDVILALESNVEVMSSLGRFYTGLSTDDAFPLRKQCGELVNEFIFQLEALICDFKFQIARASTLVNITNSRKELVLQHLQRQSTENMEDMSRHMEQEAVIVRIITIVTLIYLPATFVSGGDMFSATAMVRWLQVALPLTGLTLLLAWLGNAWAKRQRDHQGTSDGSTWLRWPFQRAAPSSPLPMYNSNIPMTPIHRSHAAATTP